MSSISRIDVGSVELLPGADSETASWFIGELLRYRPFAHHPTCSYYDHHLVRIGSKAICLGCFALFGGVVATLGCIAVAFYLGHPALKSIGAVHLIGLGIAMYLPTLLQPFLQNKAFKFVSRFLLGSAIVALCFGAIILLPVDWTGLLLRIIFALTFWIVYRVTQRFRTRHTPSPCTNCPDGRFPFCAANRDRLPFLINGLSERAENHDRPFVDLVAKMANGNAADVELLSLSELLAASNEVDN